MNGIEGNGLFWPRLVLRKMFGPERVEVTGEWGRQYNNEELLGLYSTPNIFRQSNQGEGEGSACGLYGESRDVFWGLVRNLSEVDHL